MDVMGFVNIKDLEKTLNGNEWNVSITSSEHPFELVHRIKRQTYTYLSLIIACFLMSIALLYITYYPPIIDGTNSKNIQENAFHAFVLFFTSCASLLIGRQTK